MRHKAAIDRWKPRFRADRALLAAHEKLRHSASIQTCTFASMAEAVLVVDSAGEIVLSNSAATAAALRPGMTIAE